MEKLVTVTQENQNHNIFLKLILICTTSIYVTPKPKELKIYRVGPKFRKIENALTITPIDNRCHSKKILQIIKEKTGNYSNFYAPRLSFTKAHVMGLSKSMPYTEAVNM